MKISYLILLIYLLIVPLIQKSQKFKKDPDVTGFISTLAFNRLAKLVFEKKMKNVTKNLTTKSNITTFNIKRENQTKINKIQVPDSCFNIIENSFGHEGSQNYLSAETR